MRIFDQDTRFLRLAFEVSKESDDPKAATDPRAAVGAVICLDDNVIAKSANRLPPGLRGDLSISDPTSPERYTLIEHAERCAIFDAAIELNSLTGATMYCTRFPCIECARTIAYFGIDRMVVGAGFKDEGDWIESQRAARKMLRAHQIKIRYMRLDDESILYA